MSEPDPERLRRALAAEGLGEEHGPEVLEMWRADRRQWRACCGLLCDPCVLTLARVVDRLRADGRE